mgnify:CR=1 FL=1
MIQIDINNKQDKIEIDQNYKKLFKKIAKIAADMENYESGTVSVALIRNDEIRELNKKFRNKNESTDVLSFPMDEKIWGDIIISVDKVIEQAEEYGHSIKRELIYLYTHGILHLLGYDHKEDSDKKIMRQKEEEILSEFGLQRD